jgi:hypothetical protein
MKYLKNAFELTQLQPAQLWEASVTGSPKSAKQMKN